MKYRVWDKINKRFLTRDTEFAILSNGRLIVSSSDWYENFVNVNQSDFKIQYSTGLKDKNGEEIYEGDIVKQFIEDKEGDYWRNSAIAFVNGSFLVEEDDCSTLLGLYHNHIEVIGNIFENPSLLDYKIS